MPAASAPPPVQKNWAGLFKGANASSKPAVVIYTDSNGSKGPAEKTSSVPAAPAASPEKAAVAAKDDPLSAKLGGKQGFALLAAEGWGGGKVSNCLTP